VNGAMKKMRPMPLMDDTDIFSQNEFEGILKLERARADRSGTSFSLIALEIANLREKPRDLKRMVQALRTRIRITDVIGWLDEKNIAVLLPSTDLEGGWIFAINFERQYFTKQQPAPFTVYCYPEHWMGNGNGSHPTSLKQGQGRTTSGMHFSNVCQQVERSLATKIPIWKRILDITGSLVGLIVTAPLFAILSLYIKFISPGPVFFKQNRVGYKGALFTFLKFRTMRLDSDPSSHRAHLKDLINSEEPMEKLDSRDDPRIIFGGRIIRKACLDEFPQLINVLKGEMSLVGPRPCLPYEAAEYLKWHKYRFDLLPGITGLWQVSGKNKLTFKQMIRLDISYCQNSSLWLDVTILLRTLPAIVEFVLEAIGNALRGSIKESSPNIESEPLAICQILENFSERF
jgi:lipopolysaccharide/colanic/teichoic acid biosynthesis glycosyltransferase